MAGLVDELRKARRRGKAFSDLAGQMRKRRRQITRSSRPKRHPTRGY